MRQVILQLIVLSAVAHAQKTPEWWGESWEKAFEEAKARNVPVLVCINQDGEEANERAIVGLYQDTTFANLTRECVALIVSPDMHAETKQDVKGTSVAACSRFGGIPCLKHKEFVQFVRSTLFANQAVTTPHHAVLLPDEKIIARVQDVAGINVYVDAVKQAQRKLGVGLTSFQYRDAKAALQRAKEAARGTEIGPIVKALVELEKAAAGSPFLKHAEDIHKVVLGRARAVIAEAQGLAKEGRHADGLRRLADGMAGFKGTAVHKELKDADLAMRKTKEGQAAAQILEREEKARPHFEKGREFETQKEYVKAVTSYARVLGQAPGTALSESSRSRIDDLAADPDIGPLVKSVADPARADDDLRRAMVLLKTDRAKGLESLREVTKMWAGSSAAERAKKLLESGD